MKQREDSKAVSGDSGPEPVMENNNEETNEIQDTLDENNQETNEIQDTMDVSENRELNEISLGLNDSATNQRTISPCNNNNQEEIQEAIASFPTPTDESQQYLEQKDTSFTQVV